MDFAKQVPGFLQLGREDQIALLKASTIEVTGSLPILNAALPSCPRGTPGKSLRTDVEGLGTSETPAAVALAGTVSYGGMSKYSAENQSLS